MKRKKIKVSDRSNRLLKFTDAHGGCIVSSGNIATRLTSVPADDEFADGCTVVEITDEDLKSNKAYKTLQDNAHKVFSTEAAVSVVLPVARLRAVLEAVECALIRIDLLPALFAPDTHTMKLVDGNTYLQSQRTTVTLDGLRIVEVDDPTKANSKIAIGESAALLGCMRTTVEWFEDEGLLQAQRQRKEVKANLRKEAAAKLKTKLSNK